VFGLELIVSYYVDFLIVTAVTHIDNGEILDREN
jgi:hypothetical protein